MLVTHLLLLATVVVRMVRVVPVAWFTLLAHYLHQVVVVAVRKARVFRAALVVEERKVKVVAAVMPVDILPQKDLMVEAETVGATLVVVLVRLLELGRVILVGQGLIPMALMQTYRQF